MLIFRRRSVSPEDAGSLEGDVKLTDGSAAIHKLVEDYLDFPKYNNESIDLLSWIPRFFPPFMYRRRWIEFILFCGATLKSSLLEELSVHIVVETLLLSITMQPIISNTLDVTTIKQSVLFISICAASVVLLVSITSHVLLACAVITINESVLMEWLLDKVDSLVTFGMLHAVSFFLFLWCLLIWPTLSLSEDPYHVGEICSGLILGAIVISHLSFGPVQILYRAFSPELQLYHSASDVALRKQVERDVLIKTQGKLLLKQTAGHSSASSEEAIPSLSFKVLPSSVYQPADRQQEVDEKTSSSFKELETFLVSLKLEKYISSFQKQNITSLNIVKQLDNADYHALHVTIGDRIRMKSALACMNIENGAVS